MALDQGTSPGSERASAGSGMTAGDFLSWWSATLAGLMPDWLKAAFVANRKWVVIRRDGETFMVYSDNGKPIGTLADSGKARARVRSGDALALLAPEEAFLRQRRLPATSEAHLRNALRLQIAADTPFDIDEVFDDCRVVPGSAEAGQILAEQALVKRDVVTALVDAANANRIDLAGIDIAGPDEKPIGFNLLPEHQRARADGFLPSLNRGLALAAVVLAVLTGALSLMAMDRKLASLESESTAVRAQASSVLALQRQALARVEAIRTIEQRTTSSLRFTVLLDAIAEALPEDSWLEGLAYDGKQISLVGLSRSSDSLVSRLEGIPGVASARVVSSMMHDSRLKADRFRIELMLEQDLAPTANDPASSKEDNG